MKRGYSRLSKGRCIPRDSFMAHCRDAPKTVVAQYEIARQWTCHPLKGAAANSTVRTKDAMPVAPRFGRRHAECGSPPVRVMDNRRSLTSASAATFARGFIFLRRGSQLQTQPIVCQRTTLWERLAGLDVTNIVAKVGEERAFWL